MTGATGDCAGEQDRGAICAAGSCVAGGGLPGTMQYVCTDVFSSAGAFWKLVSQQPCAGVCHVFCFFLGGVCMLV